MGDPSQDRGSLRPGIVPGINFQVQPNEALEALERIRASRTFAHSQRLLDFLDFVVGVKLRGDGSSLKETAIAIGLYHRDPSFDPKVDSIVRTQARRLRERLSEYYSNEGATDPMVIRMNRGSYTPVFEKRDSTAPEKDEPAAAVRPARRLWLAAVAALAIAAGFFVYLSSRPARTPRVLRYKQLTHDGQPKWLAGGDASRLYIGTGTVTSLGIAQLSISQGESVDIPLPMRSLYVLGASPDGAELLAEEYPANTPDYPGRLWSIPVIGGPPRRLGTMLANDAAWSPDGNMLAYCNRGDLFLAKSDGTEARKVASVAGLAYAPQVSPDGTRIRFSVMDLKSRSRSLWEVSREGRGLRPLLPGWHSPPDEENGKWTADGRTYVFQSRGQIWTLAERAGYFRSAAMAPVQLTDSPLSLSSPLPSKDGTKLFVVGRTQRGELSRYDRKAREFLPFLSAISAQGVDFSKDGRWVAYVTYPEGVLWRSRTDGSERLRLSNPPLYPILPRWSPDGQQIAFWGFTPGKTTRVYKVGANGGALEPLLPEDQDRLEDPNWSPDGSRIVFARDSSPQGLTIEVLEVASGRCVTLPGSTNLASPRWSPNGRYVVAMRRDALGLVLFDFQTQKWSPLVSMQVGYPSWSRDGQYIYFLRVPDNPAVLRVGLNDRAVEPITDLRNVPMTGFLGPWLGLTPDGSPLVLRDSSSQDIYELEWEMR